MRGFEIEKIYVFRSVVSFTYTCSYLFINLIHEIEGTKR